MTSPTLVVLAVAALATTGVSTAALLDQQAAPVVAPGPPDDVDFAVDLGGILADVESAVEQSVDADAIAKQVELAMQGAQLQMKLAAPPRLGVGVRDVTADEAREAGLDGIAGSRVTSVEPESAAARAGLADGDVIVQIDGQDVRSARHLTRLIGETPAGRVLPIAYLRAGQRADVTVTLEAAPRAVARDLPMREPFLMAMGRSRSRLGVGVQDLTPQLAQYFGVTGGVLVTQVNDGSPAARAGVKAGDVITRVAATDVTRTSDITRALAREEGGAAVSIDVSREGTSQTLTVTLDARPTRTPVIVRPRGRTAAEQ